MPVAGGRDGVQMAAIGLEMAGSVVGGLLLGSFLDGRFGTDPWLALVGVVAGAVTAMVRMVDLARRFERQRRAAEAAPAGNTTDRPPPAQP